MTGERAKSREKDAWQAIPHGAAPSAPALYGRKNVAQSANYNGAALAYLGDAVLELLTRHTLLLSGVTNVGELNRMAAAYVRATVQSEAVDRLLPVLTEEENAVYRRGRNASSHSIPKSASPREYRRATGMEALFAHLYLAGQFDRLHELFAVAFPQSSAHLCQEDKQ